MVLNLLMTLGLSKQRLQALALDVEDARSCSFRRSSPRVARQHCNFFISASCGRPRT